jgi:hypothetical protein
VSPDFRSRHEHLGVFAQSLTAAKEILSDGSAFITIQIEGLTNSSTSVPIEGVRLDLQASVGIMGAPRLDARAEQLGSWVPESGEPSTVDRPPAPPRDSKPG